MRGFFSFPLLLCILRSSYGYEASRPSSFFRKRFNKSDELHLTHLPSTSPASVFFEVGRPLDPPPNRKPCASIPVLQHAFGNTYEAATANYTPPSVLGCRSAHDWALVVLRWHARCRGRQYDRMSGVWLGGVELLRTCTAEPTKQGISWEVKKEITAYASVLSSPNILAVELANVVDHTFTGIFHVNVTLHFFAHPDAHLAEMKPGPLSEFPADLIVPISLPSTFPSGHWFLLKNASSSALKRFTIPPHAVRAWLEVYVSFHGDDEFWYSNPPNDYVVSNNLTGSVPANGPFREVEVFLDGRLVGAIWPFPVVYTGGIVNLFWRPAAAIGAFDLPTYGFELSPFVGSLVDGKKHSISMKVKNAIGLWTLDANLHVWLDPSGAQTHGQLIAYSAPEYSPDTTSHFQALDGTFHVSASRSLSYSGYVASSMGNITVAAEYGYAYNNMLSFEENATLQRTLLSIEVSTQITAYTLSNVVYNQKVSTSFPFDLVCLDTSGVNDTMNYNCNLSHSLNKDMSTFSTARSSFSSLRNTQQCEGEITVKDNLVTSGLAGLQQSYKYEGSDGCYARRIRTKNTTLLDDASSSSCSALG